MNTPTAEERAFQIDLDSCACFGLVGFCEAHEEIIRALQAHAEASR